MKKISNLLLFALFIFCFSAKSQSNIDSDIYGYGFLKKIIGQWNGKVFSSTSSGSFDKWYVDFRPVSGSQVSQYSMLDSNTVNITSFFVVKYNNKLKIAQRTEGCFQDKCCVTYEVMDSVNEASGYYRFADFVSGKKRACTIYKFTKDSYTMEVYTNKFNKSETLQLHSKFEPKFTSRTAANDAINEFKFPQPVVAKDLTGAFLNMNESIFFNLENDPYNAASQPKMGTATINISIDKKLKISKSDELCILLTTEPLFEGIKYIKENLNYLSKYVYLSVDTKTYTIKNLHPGKYYVYSFNDINKDKKHLKGDYMSSNLENSIKVQTNGNVVVDTKIDFIIPY
ncbi:MAG: hypothetical protein HXX09_06540 [Bacteroidetes bacterium]|nr:hypothetical protein [Bacteroidota bacterium]